LADELGLAQPEIAWHTERDRIAEAGCFLGLLTGTLAKFATDLKLMMQTEVGEASPTSPTAAPPRPCRRSATRSHVAIFTPAPRRCGRAWLRFLMRWLKTMNALRDPGRSNGLHYPTSSRSRAAHWRRPALSWRGLRCMPTGCAPTSMQRAD